MTRDEAMQAMKQYGSQRKAAEGLRVSRKTLRKALAVVGSDKGVRQVDTQAAAKSAKAGRTLSEFRATYDKATIIPAKVTAALKQLGPQGWEYEVEFAKLAGVSLMDLGKFRDKFAEHVVQIGRDSRRAWAGSKSTAQAMREML